MKRTEKVALSLGILLSVILIIFVVFAVRKMSSVMEIDSDLGFVAYHAEVLSKVVDWCEKKDGVSS